jgi:hypothetical protein
VFKAVRHIKYALEYTVYVREPLHMAKDNPKEAKEAVKRTTIILDDEERKYIDSLIAEGKEAGIKPLISKLLDVYRSMAIYDWRFPGEYYVGVSRVAFVNVEFVNVLLQYIPESKWREVGQKIGDAARVSMEATLNLETTSREKWGEVLGRLRVQGFGEFFPRDKYFIIKAPFINNAEVLCGFLEKLLGINLNVRTATAPFVLEIVEEQSAAKKKA